MEAGSRQKHYGGSQPNIHLPYVDSGLTFEIFFKKEREADQEGIGFEMELCDACCTHVSGIEEKFMQNLSDFLW